MNANKSKAGFTLVELMVAALATTLLAMTVGLTLYFGWLGWNRVNDSVDMQRDTSLAMRVMARAIRGSSSLDDSVASELDCTNPSNVVSFVQSGGNLDMEIDGTFQMHLIRDVVNSFTPTVDSADGSVDLVLQLNAGDDVATVSETVYTRN